MKKRLLWILALAGIVFAVVVAFPNRKEEPVETRVAAPPPPAPMLYPPASPPRPRKVEVAPPVAAPEPSVPGPPQPQAPAPARAPAIPTDEAGRMAAQATSEVDTLGRRVREYSLRFDGNPTGTNAEITAALTGGNPKSVRFLEGDPFRLNEHGELLDTWGTPYFFHQLSADHMETRSAGPDKVLWTDDDVITR